MILAGEGLKVKLKQPAKIAGAQRSDFGNRGVPKTVTVQSEY